MAATKITGGMSSSKSFNGDITLVSEDWREGSSWFEETKTGDYIDKDDLLDIISELQEALYEKD